MTTRPRPPRAAMDFSRASMCVHRGMTNHGHVYEHMDSTYIILGGVGLSLRPEVDSERRASHVVGGRVMAWRRLLCVCVCVCVLAVTCVLKLWIPFHTIFTVGEHARTVKKSARGPKSQVNLAFGMHFCGSVASRRAHCGT